MNRSFSMARFLRSILVAFACAILFLTNVAPALAIGSTPSRPSEGEPPLNDIFKESQDAIRPENALDADKVIERANAGLNEVQKDADIDQMNRPENSRQATSAAEQVQRALGKAVEKVTGNAPND
ncbi:MAG: hypothetical protein MUF72_16940 [Elainella sp. Prado103]|jgi:hypothetical protein|nr:hypothetical protein [Elainella sp. Prado103]